MSFQVLSERLTALQESNAQLRDLIDRLATLKFQPGSVPLDNEDGNVMVELTAEIHQTLKDQDEDFELLQEEVHDLDPGRPGGEPEQQKRGLEQAVTRGIKELKTCEIAFRRAQLSARRNLQAAQRTERELLLQSYLNPQSSPSSPVSGQRRRNQQSAELSEEQKTVNASSDVTLALRRTHELMASELSRSQFAHDTLKESTAALSQLSETYSTLDTLLSSSRNLLGTLLRSQKSDTWYLETAFYVLLSTIAWLVFRRFLYGPMWWFLWFPLKMFYKGWMGVFAAVGLTGGAGATGGAVSSIVGRDTPLHSSVVSASSVSLGGSQVETSMRATDVTEDGVAQGSGDSMSEEVGRIIDESRNDQIADSEPAKDDGTEKEGDSQPNPKKRMWEEDKEAAKEDQRKKDEL